MPTWVLSAPDGPYVSPMNLAIRDCHCTGEATLTNIGTGTKWIYCITNYDISTTYKIKNAQILEYTVMGNSLRQLQSSDPEPLRPCLLGMTALAFTVEYDWYTYYYYVTQWHLRVNSFEKMIEKLSMMYKTWIMAINQQGISIVYYDDVYWYVNTLSFFVLILRFVL